MKIWFGTLGLVVTAIACGALQDEGHTGGKTSWLDGCQRNSDCVELEGSSCIQKMCTKVCDSECDVPNTICLPIVVNDSTSNGIQQACVPICESEARCNSFGDGYSCLEHGCLLTSDGSPGEVSTRDAESTQSFVSSEGADAGAPVPWSIEVEAWQPKDPNAPPDGTPVAMNGWLSVQGVNLVNQTLAPVQLRGVSSMWLNWDIKGYATDFDGMKFMRDNWNLQVFRAAMGVEEDGGYLNNTAATMAQVRRIVQNAIDLGVYVIVDWHDHNAHLNLDASRQFFEAIAREFGAYPNVLYEPFNEPLHPNQVDWGMDIKPYHEAIIPVIRQHAPQSIVILGTPQWSLRVDDAARDPVMGSNLMYTLHFYSCDHLEEVRQQADVALSLGAPLFVTEWAATTQDGGVAEKALCAEEALLWHEWMNTNNVSWTAWKLDGCTDSSCLLLDYPSSSGGWKSSNLQAHGEFVVQRLLAP